MFEVIVFSLLGGVVSLAGGILLISRQKMAVALAKYATPFAAGALLAAVFLDLVKEGIEHSSADAVLYAMLTGIVVFFFGERFLHWFHHHDQHEESEHHDHKVTRSLIIVGDTVHNALDGITIAAAFLVSVPVGIVTTIAVAAHEIPQEIGDFGLLLSRGMSRFKVVVVNVLSALAATVMAVITFALGSHDRLPVGILLGLSAGFLLYIAMSDIIPSIHHSTPKHKLFSLQPVLLVVGIVVVGLAIHFTHGFLE